MAEEIINIATLTVDRTGANQSIVDTKQQIFDLQKANAELRKDINKNGDASGEQTKKFVENEIALKKLNAQYRTQSAALNDLTLAELKENKALTDGAKSRGQAIAQTAELKKIRDQLNVTTEEGAAALDLLNAKINENDAFLKGNASELEKQKDNVGNYPELLNNVGSAYGGVVQQITGFIQSSSDVISSFTEIGTQASNSIQNMLGFETAAVRAARANELLAINTEEAEESASGLGDAAIGAATGQQSMGEAADTATGGLLGMVKAAWAFVATPIGAIITAIVVVLAILYNIFKSFQPLIDKIEQGFAALSAVINVVKNTILAVITGTKSLGEAFSSLGGDMSKAAEEAAALTKAQQDLEDAQKSQEVITARNRAEINKLNVALKNRTLTEKERLKIAAQIEDAEKKDYEQRKALVDQEVKNARAAIAIKAQFTEEEKRLLKETGDATKELAESRGGIYDEEYDALNKARLKAIALEDENTTNLEKVYNKRDKLEDDAAAKAQARRDKAIAAQQKALQATIKNMETEIAIQRAKNAQLNNSDEERLAFINRITQQELDLIAFKRSKNVITEKEAQLATLNLAKTQSTETLALAEKTIDGAIEAQKKGFEAKKSLDEETFNEAVANAAFLRDLQEKEIQNSKLLESEKFVALTEIRKGYNESVEILEKTRAETEKADAEIARQEAQTLSDAAFEIRMLQLEEQGGQEAELQKDLLAIQLEQTKAHLDAEFEAGKISAAELRALREMEDKKYAVAVKKIDKEVNNSKKQMYADNAKAFLAASSSIFGESKALAIASALIDTYQGIAAGVKLGYPAAIPAVALAAATGFAAVRNILKTNKDGGGGGSASSTSTGSATGGGTATAAAIFENPAKTQTVATVDAAPLQDSPIVAPPVLVLETLDEAKNMQQVKINSNG